METGVLILKQGYLKKLPNQTKIGASLKRADRRWVTFGLTSDQQPYLAFYTNAESVTTTAPLKAILLRTCRHITKSLNLKGHTNVFTMTLADRQLSLMAPNLDQMDDWCRILDTTLKSLGILKPNENLYSVRWSSPGRPEPSPEEQGRLSVQLPPPPSSASSNSLGTRDPTSPLPPAPRGRLPPPPPDHSTSAAAPSVDSSWFNESEMSQRHAEVAAASGEVYEAVWDRSSGPAAGGGLQPQQGAPSSSSSAAASGAASPGALGPPPPIPHRSRIGSPGEPATVPRPRPLPSPHRAAISGSTSTGTGTTTRTPQRHQAAPPPSQAETDYGVIWNEPASAPDPAGQGPDPAVRGPDPAGRGLDPAGRSPDPAGRVQGWENSGDIAPPRYTERDEGHGVTLLDLSLCPGDLTSSNAAFQPGAQPVRPLVGPNHSIASLLAPLTSPPYSPHASPGGATGYSFSPAPASHTVSPSSPLGVLPSKMMEALGISSEWGGGGGDGDPSSNPDPQVYGWNAPPLDDHDAPPPYMPRNVTNRGPLKSLKQTQVDAMQKEMDHAGGVKVTLRKLDCHLTIGWVDAFGSTWIAGWNQKARPFLHNAFHVGDQVVSVNGQVVENARMAHKLIKHSDDQAKISFILKRVPNARVFALKRSEDGEDLGFRREGGTGEITDVVPFGVAARHGVPARAPSMDRRNLCNWFITEINMRPINLFFKEDEIEKRLNAVGKDISILIQPIDFINEMKAQLKKNLKNYKDFVVQ